MVFSTAYPRIHFTIYLEVYLGRSGIFDCVSAYPRIHFTIYLEVYLGRGGIFDCVSAYPLHNIPRSLLGEEWYFPLCIRVSTYPLYNIPRSLLGEEWYFRLRIRVSAYPLHNILLRSLLGEGCYFRLRIRVSSLFRGAASKWRGILQLLRIVPLPASLTFKYLTIVSRFFRFWNRLRRRLVGEEAVIFCCLCAR